MTIGARRRRPRRCTSRRSDPQRGRLPDLLRRDETKDGPPAACPRCPLATCLNLVPGIEPERVRLGRQLALDVAGGEVLLADDGRRQGLRDDATSAGRRGPPRPVEPELHRTRRCLRSRARERGPFGHGAVLTLGGGTADTPSVSYWWGTGFILRLTGVALDYLIWSELDEAERSGVREAIADPVVDEEVRAEALMRRSEKLHAIGSE